MLDKYLFRQEKLPKEAATSIPRDLAWTIEGYEERQNTTGDSQLKHTSTVIIEELTDDANITEWRDEDRVSSDNVVAAPPRIRGIVSETIYQNESGTSRVGVVVDIDGPDDGEYEVVVTPA